MYILSAVPSTMNQNVKNAVLHSTKTSTKIKFYYQGH